MAEAPIDVKRAHRWFAVELNNLAWELVEADRRTDEDVERMIHAAHSACFHWLQVGDLLNHLRAECLLATAYAKAGLPEDAVRHAERCLALSSDADDTQTAWDRATAHGCAAAAYAVAGRLNDARAEYRLAKLAAEKLDDPTDGKAFERLFPEP